jgi:uncharacterized membrane protein YfhO
MALAKCLPIFISVFMIFELGINGYYQLNGISEEWHYASRTSYDEQTKRILPASKRLHPILTFIGWTKLSQIQLMMV